MRKNAIITFDYEVFLGRNTGTVENSVLRPTRAILEVLRSNNAKAIFFVDTTWLMFLKENFPVDYIKVADQLKEIVASGSSVELHLHPQWLNATVEDGNIVFGTFEHYKLQSLGREEIINLFQQAIGLLKEITNKNISCFRAGGWCIEPFSDVKPAFEFFNIKYDFSVVPGVFLNEGKVYDYDFSKVPRLPFYKFQNSVNENITDGSFTEIPVSTYQNSPFYRIANKSLLKLVNDKVFGDGKSAKEKSMNSTITQALKFTSGMLTIDKTSTLLFRYLLSVHFGRARHIVAVSHPKIISKQALRNLEFVASNYNTLNSSELDKL
jgi:hypothetical protein